MSNETNRIAPPSHVQISSYRFRVSLSTAEMDAAIVKDKTDSMGKTDFIAQTILIRPNMGPDAEVDTVFHEVIESLMVQMCYTNLFFEGKTERRETFAESFTTALLDCLRRNPELVAYLMQEHL